MEDHGVVSLVHDMNSIQLGPGKTVLQDLGCGLPPAGWFCTRMPGHDGPCACVPLIKQTAPPDPKQHFRTSMLKSFLRMIGYVALVQNLRIGVGLLIIAEFIGIIEELV